MSSSDVVDEDNQDKVWFSVKMLLEGRTWRVLITTYFKYHAHNKYSACKIIWLGTYHSVETRVDPRQTPHPGLGPHTQDRNLHPWDM